MWFQCMTLTFHAIACFSFMIRPTIQYNRNNMLFWSQFKQLVHKNVQNLCILPFYDEQDKNSLPQQRILWLIYCFSRNDSSFDWCQFLIKIRGDNWACECYFLVSLKKRNHSQFRAPVLIMNPQEQGWGKLININQVHFSPLLLCQHQQKERNKKIDHIKNESGAKQYLWNNNSKI